MKKLPGPPTEDFEIRCPKLGHQISFSYCISEDNGQPCLKILDCWHQYFDIISYLRRRLTPEQWNRLVSRPSKPKMLSLVELIEQAKKRRK